MFLGRIVGFGQNGKYWTQAAESLNNLINAEQFNKCRPRPMRKLEVHWFYLCSGSNQPYYLQPLAGYQDVSRLMADPTRLERTEL